ncbi:MAG: hypothetical protein DCC71_13730 [Proteobacteria bacterium]|nr:MAG: hypothetical protein DCC71_13730 [Pseudomonadota bacterium]
MQQIPIPSGWGLLREARIALDLAAGLRHAPNLVRAPRGDRSPVLLLPGYAAGDTSMFLLRCFLRGLGWDARGWGLGINRGDAPALLPRVVHVLETMAARSRRAVALVGWSMGGFLAREAARDRPELVSQVITLGTPVIGGPKYTAVAETFRRRGYDLDAIEAECEARACRPIAAPVTAIYSRRDGVVAWQACIDRTSRAARHVEVHSTHAGLGFDPRVWRIVAERLATDEAERPSSAAR